MVFFPGSTFQALDWSLEIPLRSKVSWAPWAAGSPGPKSWVCSHKSRHHKLWSGQVFCEKAARTGGCFWKKTERSSKKHNKCAGHDFGIKSPWFDFSMLYSNHGRLLRLLILYASVVATVSSKVNGSNIYWRRLCCGDTFSRKDSRDMKYFLEMTVFRWNKLVKMQIS